MLPKNLSQFARVNARDAGNLFPFQPVAEAPHRIPMAVFIRIVTHDKRLRMDFPAFHENGKPVRSDGKRRNPVVARQRISKRHQLSGIRRVRQTLRISGHGSIENHFTRHRLLIAKRLAGKPAPVVKD